MNPLDRTKWRTRKVLACVLTCLAMLGISAPVWATATCTWSGKAFTLNMPAAIAVPRDVPVGTVLTPWVSLPMDTNWYSCTVTEQTYVGIGLQAPSFSRSGQTITANGINVNVLNTNVPGVGIALMGKLYLGGWLSGYFDLSAPASALLPAPWSGWNNNIDGTPTEGGMVTAALVKTGPISGGSVAAGLAAQAALAISYVPQTSLGMVTISMTSTTVNVLGCLTPDVLVDLGTHKASEFNGAGSVTLARSFSIALNSCPAGLNTVQYQVDAVTSVVNATRSVVALSPSSTATGIGVQLLDGNGNVFPLGTATPLSGYNSGAGGSYTIPLKARYYQTGSAVGAGSADSAMTFTMTYQ